MLDIRLGCRGCEYAQADLCSDTAGDTPVNSYTIPYALAAGYFHCITFDNGAALGAAIQSVALIALLDPGAVTVNIDNIIAGTEFGLASVIGKNDGFWWPILSINGTTVTIGCNSGAGTGVLSHIAAQLRLSLAIIVITRR